MITNCVCKDGFMTTRIASLSLASWGRGLDAFWTRFGHIDPDSGRFRPTKNRGITRI